MYTNYRIHNELVSLRKKVEGFETGDIYIRFTKEYERKLTEKQRLIDRSNRQIEKLKEKCQLLKSENSDLKSHLFSSDNNVSRLEDLVEDKDRHIEDLEEIIARKDKEIERMRSLLNTDSSNSGLPTSLTSLNKEKVRPNSREKTGRKIGGQPGHKKHKLEAFKEDEISDHIIHEYDSSCPYCSSELVDTHESIDKDEYEIETVVHKIRHSFKIYECPCCGKRVHKKIPLKLKEENQYGSNIDAFALSLMNSTNAAINKTASFLSGISENEVNLSEGYIAKLEHKAASKLFSFRDDLRKLLIAQPIVYWDDTVVMVDRKRACLRFYGNEKIAWYKAHEHKDLESIMDDDILKQLNDKTYVMHDHNTINYNEAFVFINLECNIHLERDLEKIIQILHHEWADELKKLINEYIHERKILIDRNIHSFDEDKVTSFRSGIETILEKAKEENNNDFNKYYGQEEKALISRLCKYKENYFKWIEDFSLPVSDNLSERNLRCIKSKLKISGQFRSEKTADNYALIKSYIETCKKNGINEITALTRLSAGDPYTVKEIFNIEDNR